MTKIKVQNIAVCFCCLLMLAGCSPTIASRTEFVLDTLCTITLYEYGKEQVYNEIFGRLREIENRMSVHRKGTELDNINAAAGLAPVKVSADVFMVIETALYYASLSGSAFDPSVGPLVSLWDIGGDPRVPGQEEIDRVLSLVNWNDVELDRQNSTVFLKKPGMVLDLGAIAKGYAADEAAAIIRKAKIPRAIIDLGGNILLVGEKKDKSLWGVGIQNPQSDRGGYLGIVRVREKTVVTSGVYERFFWADDVLYHHIFSPFDGYPARNNFFSVTIISDRSIDADALSTAVFVMGYEKGSALVDSLEGVDAVFVFDDQSIRITSGVDFTLTDDDYRVVRD
ncbi:MAG: FAD:protein FMN transferase [Treponema sp.]|jgi:thiamine biosynthesis lipoprotein|nr:FAD:protein FMN transferase [Treponema sp.]